MDSLDFLRSTVLVPFSDRDTADALLAKTLQWVALRADPERVFDESRLRLWATTHGYMTASDRAQIVALLKESRRWVPRDVPESVALDDWIYRLGGWTT